MKFRVFRYYSSFVVTELEAGSKEEAYEKTKEIEINPVELHNNALKWKDADIVEQMDGQKQITES